MRIGQNSLLHKPSSSRSDNNHPPGCVPLSSVSFAREDFIVVVLIAWVTGAERGHKGREKGKAFLPYFLLAAARQAVSNIVSFCSVCSLPFNFRE